MGTESQDRALSSRVREQRKEVGITKTEKSGEGVSQNNTAPEYKEALLDLQVQRRDPKATDTHTECMPADCVRIAEERVWKGWSRISGVLEKLQSRFRTGIVTNF